MDEAAAAGLARQLHAGQADKLGEPYIDHLSRVAHNAVRHGASRDQVIAAWLHDAVEDGHIDLDGLRRAGVPAESVRLVEILTHRDGESYDAYAQRCAADPGARLIKRLDVADNADQARLMRIPERKVRDRLAAKYARAAKILSDP